MLDQIRTVDKIRLVKRLGAVTAKTLSAVLTTLQEVFSELIRQSIIESQGQADFTLRYINNYWIILGFEYAANLLKPRSP